MPSHLLLNRIGAYNLDHYYVGNLTDPQSGNETTDRELERKLTAIGNAPLSSRHANLLMRPYPIVRNAKEYTTKQQLAYLNKVLAVYPMCAEAWLELAALHRDGKLTDAQEATRLVNNALNVFYKFPDFSWKIVDDLLTPQKDKQYRTNTFVKLANSYEILGRPDLTCEARHETGRIPDRSEGSQESLRRASEHCPQVPRRRPLRAEDDR